MVVSVGSRGEGSNKVCFMEGGVLCLGLEVGLEERMELGSGWGTKVEGKGLVLGAEVPTLGGLCVVMEEEGVDWWLLCRRGEDKGVLPVLLRCGEG